MKRGAPMKRTAWLRTKPKDEPTPPLRERSLAALFEVKPLRVGVIRPVTGDALPVPKTVQHRNRRLLDLARGMPCLISVADVCNRDADTTVAAHSNWAVHGKAAARKADDQWSCWSCSACHGWLDQGGAPEDEKLAAFMAGHRRQVVAWHRIAADGRARAPDRAAARWALALIAAETPAANEPIFNRQKRGP